TFNGHVIGELQAITYSVTREKVPVYVMGDPNPKSFSRGKRGIAGSLVFTVFDRDTLSVLKDNATVHRHLMNQTGAIAGNGQIDNVHEQAKNATGKDFIQPWKTGAPADFVDEIPPFDITISFLNEYGQAATMTIYGVEILNEGSGMSIDDITTEKACTFIARNVKAMKNMDEWE
ncbi:MAG: hypothetical protein ACRC5C_12135, partial [Bacilli bacterium]